MIDRIYQTIKMLANTDGRGNVKPSDFDKALYNVITEIVEEYPFEVNRWQNRENTGLVNDGVENVSDLIRKKMDLYLSPFSSVFSSDIFSLPLDLKYIDSVIYNNKAEVSCCKNNSEFNLLKNSKYAKPSVDFPIALQTELGLYVLPVTIIDFIKITYVRKPKVPKWTYTVLDGVELYNPNAPDFQDADIHISEESNIIARLCIKFGINLKEPDLQASGTAEESQEFNKQNTP